MILHETTAIVRAKTAVDNLMITLFLFVDKVLEMDLAITPNLFMQSRRNKASSQLKEQMIIVAIAHPKKETD